MEMLLSLAVYMSHIIMIFTGFIIVFNTFLSLRKNVTKEKVRIMLFNKTTKEKIPIKYWENSIGRSGYSDVILQDSAVSRNHGVLFRREDGWLIADTGSKSGIKVNGKQIKESTKLHIGDTMQMGFSELSLEKTSQDMQNSATCKKGDKEPILIPAGVILFIITIFTFLMAAETCVQEGNIDIESFFPVILINLVAWICFIVNKYIFKRVNFELENLGVFLTGISVVIAGSVNIRQAYIQIVSLAIGMVFFNILLFLLKNPNKAMKLRPYVAAFAIIILLANLIFGKIKHGAQNWIMIGPFSVQPSEIVKVLFILFGTATLEHLQTTKNLTEFIIFAGICIGFLCFMGDFGTALIFFAAFILVAFMRSGSFRTILSICFSAFLGAIIILKFKPYIANRFSAWRNVWAHINDIGYQQTRVLIYAASGGLLGVGIGKGYLRYVFGAANDLVFGMLCEEFGLIFALLIIFCFVLLTAYARKTSIKSRSAFYAIAANVSAGMLLFQAALNVFGAVDILPLTGVNLPFVSMGGTSIISSWGLLALIKAADERTFAARR
jgi:cell division protein FtsW (lipid II flippase)